MTSRRIDFDAFKNTKYFASLDGLRALCVLLVIFCHVHVPVPDWIVGTVGVDVFFVLSGFLITTLMLREKAQTGRVSLQGFYTRRFFRIVPVYFFTILLYIGALHANHDPVKTAQFNSALPYLLGFVPEYRPGSTGYMLGHAWTLGIEEKFYIVWPLLLLALYPFRARSLVGLAVLFAALSFLRHDHARAYDGLLIGAVLAVVLSQPGRLTVAVLSKIPDSLICLLLVGAYALNEYDKHYVLLFSAAVALLVASLVLRTGYVRRFLEWPVLIFIGKRSYAMYLIHVLVLNAVERIPTAYLPAHWSTVVGISYVLTIAGASVIYVVIERPCIGFGRMLSKRWSERARVPVALTST